MPLGNSRKTLHIIQGEGGGGGGWGQRISRGTEERACGNSRGSTKRGAIQVSRISRGESLFSLKFPVLDRGFLKKVYPC